MEWSEGEYFVRLLLDSAKYSVVTHQRMNLYINTHTYI